MPKLKRLARAAMIYSLAAISPCSAMTALAADNKNEQSKQVPTSRGMLRASFAPVVKTAAPAVVNIYTTRTQQSSRSPFADDPLFGRFFDLPENAPQQRQQSSLGSGVIIDANGIIVTNNHVIKNASSLSVVLADRREFEAELILADERTDLAVLRLQAPGETFHALELADTSELEVGDLVLAIGNPFGVGQTVTSGIVSALARTDLGVSDFSFFIQTDAAINPGNSGGALVNMEGMLAGVNTAIFSRSGGSNGIGFAIPAEMVRRLVDAALYDGTVRRSWLGLRGQNVTQDIAQALGLNRPIGVLVTEIYPDSPAERAGLKQKDLITSFNGRKVVDEKGLKFLAATIIPGDWASLDIIRNGSAQNIMVRLTPPPGTGTKDPVFIDGRHPLAGAGMADLDPALAEENGLDPLSSGIVVLAIKRRSLASRFGIRPGDIIRYINNNKIADLEQLRTSIDSTKTRFWKLEIERNGRQIALTVRL